jgi:hypothetical protein
MDKFGLSNWIKKKLGTYVLHVFYKTFKKSIWKPHSSQIQDIEKAAGITTRIKYNKSRTSVSQNNNIGRGHVKERKSMAYQMCEDFLLQYIRVRQKAFWKGLGR